MVQEKWHRKITGPYFACNYKSKLHTSQTHIMVQSLSYIWSFKKDLLNTTAMTKYLLNSGVYTRKTINVATDRKLQIRKMWAVTLQNSMTGTLSILWRTTFIKISTELLFSEIFILRKEKNTFRIYDFSYLLRNQQRSEILLERASQD